MEMTKQGIDTWVESEIERLGFNVDDESVKAEALAGTSRMAAKTCLLEEEHGLAQYCMTKAVDYQEQAVATETVEKKVPGFGELRKRLMQVHQGQYAKELLQMRQFWG